MVVSVYASLAGTSRRGRHAFTLVEVLISVGLLAASVAVVLAMLPALARQGEEATIRLAAEGLPEALTVELRRLAGNNLDALAERVPVMTTAPGEGLRLVADRMGERVASLDYLPPATSGAETAGGSFFLIECWRFPDAPLRYDPAGDSLALYVRVAWPYRPTAATDDMTASTEDKDRRELWFTASVLRR